MLIRVLKDCKAITYGGKIKDLRKDSVIDAERDSGKWDCYVLDTDICFPLSRIDEEFFEVEWD